MQQSSLKKERAADPAHHPNPRTPPRPENRHEQVEAELKAKLSATILLPKIAVANVRVCLNPSHEFAMGKKHAHKFTNTKPYACLTAYSAVHERPDQVLIVHNILMRNSHMTGLIEFKAAEDSLTGQQLLTAKCSRVRLAVWSPLS